MKKDTDYIKAVYNEIDKPFTSYPNKLIKHLFNKLKMNRNESILEIGCGRGEFLNEFIEKGLDGYGLDISKYSAEKFPKIKLKLSDVANDKTLPYEDAKFDYIFTKSFIEHFYQPEYLFIEMSRVLKENGFLITLTPDWEDNFKMFYDDFTHKRPFTITSLKNIHKVCGFEIIEICKFKQLPSTWSDNLIIRLFSIFLVTLTKYLVPSFFKKKFKWVRFSKETMILSIARRKS